MKNDRRLRAFRGALVATAVAVAAATTAGTAFAAGAPGGADRARAEAETRHRAAEPPKAGALTGEPGTVHTPSFSMTAVDKQTQNLYLYFPDEAGGFDPRYDVGVSFEGYVNSIDVDNDRDGWSDGGWSRLVDGKLFYSWIDDTSTYQRRDVGTGWSIYTQVLSPGDLGGAEEADLLGLDKTGVLWLYLAHPEGALAPRVRVGGGWDQYTQLAGQGDLSGDGKADLVARDKDGVLWFYKGTGDYKAPFAGRTRIGGGWNTFDRLLSVGDLDSDGTADLVARKPNGDLLRYSGTGDAQNVFKTSVKIGYGFQVYNLL
ncbi:FG-GAP repeat domain-containing protein [Streptomyces cinereoruber]|uniref:FG-GAP repeat domain-containing protein n=1 Tax=Streptomyces cinereoruber TaxID=67260 RepID=UPI003666A6F6